MKRSPGRAIVGWTAILGFLAACGGRTESASGPDAATSFETGSSASDAGQAAYDASTGPESGGSTTGDGDVCVTIDPSTYDLSCHTDADCVTVSAGTICAGYNGICGGSTINADGLVRYDAELGSIPQGPGPYCSCPYFGSPHCLQGTCTFCPAPYLGNPVPPGCPDAG